ncbi:hypothetical protein DNL40_04670 [Xylanimonas oleitrophica]|uniref:DUF2269 family protein n=1 Tax=Xylanimonas oleitrophica TaxID=2607479 RepID=A0A2W5XV05_9MICO|nr:hypothetical protein [Xylanimonas oleitrophica]PZR54218.1 hypothetical protein DNL40_04670 [Xylanimonas oleitrophica]
MTAFLLSLHVLAAILAVGPVAVAASMFPRLARHALAAPGDVQAAAPVRLLHRITRAYAVVGVAVPVLGYATGAALGVLGDAWLVVSMALTAAAAAVLVAAVLPGQRTVVAALDAPALAPAATATARRLAMLTGVFNLLWAVVVVLMIYRPGSTTGAGL